MREIIFRFTQRSSNFLILVFALIFLSPKIGFAETRDFGLCDPNEILNLERYLSSFNSMSADFVQVEGNGGQSSGSFLLKRDNLMKLVYYSSKPPFRSRLEIVYNKISKKAKQNMIYHDIDLNKIRRVNAPEFFLKAILTGKLCTEDLRCLRIENHKDLVIVELVDISKKSRGNLINLAFTKSPKLELAYIKNISRGKDITLNFFNINYNQLSEENFDLLVE